MGHQPDPPCQVSRMGPDLPPAADWQRPQCRVRAGAQPVPTTRRPHRPRTSTRTPEPRPPQQFACRNGLGGVGWCHDHGGVPCPGARRRAELGQHFLAGGWLAAELVEQAGIGAGDLVVEIGAGTGVLTEALARRAGRVVAVEYDPRLAERARSAAGRVRQCPGGDGRRAGPAAAAAAVPGGGQPAVRVDGGDPAAAARRPADPRWSGPTWWSRSRRPGGTRPGGPAPPETIAWGAWYDLATGRRLGPVQLPAPAPGRGGGAGRPPSPAAAGPGGRAPPLHRPGGLGLPPSRAATAPRPGPAVQLPAAAPPGPRPGLSRWTPARPTSTPPSGRGCTQFSTVSTGPTWEDGVRARRIRGRTGPPDRCEGDRWGR